MTIIIGAGMAGLLASGMLRNECEAIYEAQTELPNNHSAVLRFRSSIVGDTLNIPFKPVKVMKAVAPWRNPIADMLAYSLKTNGTATLRSPITARGDIDERFIAPANLIEQMAARVEGKIQFGHKTGKIGFLALKTQGKKVISTLPMHVLMDLLEYKERPQFKYVNGFNINVDLGDKVNAYATLYIPDPVYRFNRLTLTGNKLTIEIACPEYKNDFEFAEIPQLEAIDIVCQAQYHLALPQPYVPYSEDNFKVTKQQYAKILPMDEAARRRFILWASQEWGVYSLGRFATWRPGLLLDDLVNDVRVIQRIANSTDYDHRKA